MASGWRLFNLTGEARELWRQTHSASHGDDTHVTSCVLSRKIGRVLY